MILLQANNISKYYGVEPILTNIQLEVQTGNKIGLVGVNGAGKSTLIKILTGQLSYNEGAIHKPKDVQIGYLAQNSGLNVETTIWQEMLQTFSHLLQEEQYLRALEQQMSDPEGLKKESQYQQLMEEYALLSEQFRAKGGYQYEAKIRNVLHGLRFYEKDYSTNISSLSGGQKTRLAIAKLLLQEPDILILDEPTNYLDLDTVAWLEQYLRSYPGSILVVSHDRYFLDALVNIVYEIERTKSTKYHGNYSQFLEQKAANLERELKSYKKQQGEIERLEEFVAKNIARASSSKRAQSRRKQLDRMERLDQPQAKLKSASFSFEIDRQSGNDVLQLDQLAIGYPGSAPLATNISFQAYREDSLAIVGPNGIGKSTLLKTIINELEPLSGQLKKGTNVSIAYYDQEQNKLRSNKTVLQEIWDDYPSMLEKDVRSLLGQFLFSGTDVEKVVVDLSGGEKARLVLAKLILQNANLLILDEPTNHLDIYSKEVLEEALLNYPGTIIFVSHDRYFMNRMATKIIELHPDGATEYLGDYDYFVQKKLELLQIKELEQNKNALASEATPTVQKDKLSYEQEKEKQKLARKKERRKTEIEEKLSHLEEQLKEWEELLCQPEVYQDFEKVSDLQEKMGLANQEHDQLFEEWSLLEEE